MRTLAIIIALLVSGAAATAQTSAWEPMNRGLGHSYIYSLAIDPVDSLRMFCGTDAGQVYESVDGGFNWELRSSGLPPTTSGWRVGGLYLDPTDRYLLYAGFSDGPVGQRLFESRNGGASWMNIPTPNNWSVFHILPVQLTQPRLVVALGSQQGLFWTADRGEHWSSGIGATGVQCVAMHPERPAVLLAGTVGGTKPALRRSNDGGVTWLPHSMDFVKSSVGVRAITFSPSDPNTVYMGVTQGATGIEAGLYRSNDAGLTWERIYRIAEISDIAVHPRNENLIYISAIHSGVLRSKDGGRSWTTVTTGLPTTDVMRVRIAPGYPVCVFAVTLRHGAFRMVDEELREDMFTR